MIQEIENRHEVKIRKPCICHNCERKFEKGTTMIASVWKEDDIYRLYECKECMDFLDKNPDIHHEVYANDNMYQ